MVFDKKIIESQELDKYHTASFDGLKCFYRGFVFCSGKKAGEDSVDSLLCEYSKDRVLNLKNFYGAYHIIIIDTVRNEVLFFGDNAGNCCFYYSQNEKVICDSFLEITNKLKSITPNHDAIVQFLSFNCIYSYETICKEINRTNSMEYYILANNGIQPHKKILPKLGEDIKYNNFGEFMKDLSNAIEGLNIADVITGGTDSRTVLAHLCALNMAFKLVISGSDKSQDVLIAKEIAKVLNKEIYISDENIEKFDIEQFKSLFERSDGVYGVLSRYRLHKKSKMLEQMDIDLELGGVAGELYKNSFINQDFPFYNSGKVNQDKFYKMKINPSCFNQKFFTDMFIHKQQEMKNKVINNLFDEQDNKKSRLYYKVGAEILRHRMITLSNSNNLSIPSISPFSEIDVMNLTYSVNPWKLELNKWQRREISKYYPKISAIRTERGISLIDKKSTIIKEAISSYVFLFKIGLRRLLGAKSQTLNENKTQIYDAVKKLKIYKTAIQKCMELNILNKQCNIDELPDDLIDRLVTVSLVFYGQELFSIQ